LNRTADCRGATAPFIQIAMTSRFQAAPAACLTAALAAILAGLPTVATPASAQRPDGVLEPLPSIGLPPELDRVLRDYERAWSTGDAAGLAALFTAEGFATEPGGWIRGHEAIRERYAGASGPLRLRALDYAVDGDVGFIVGGYGYGPMAEDFDSGRFVLALRRGENGRWLIAADLDASNMRGGGG
jgi:ketosteroid isomerase-like protein